MDSVLAIPVENKVAIQTKEFLHFVQQRLSDEEQALFAESFCLYLQYDSVNDFVINLDDVYGWIGFSQKGTAKKLLVAKFTENIDYKVALANAEARHGGHNKESITMNIKTFKKFCMKADTKRADDILDYYVKLEELNLEYIKHSLQQSNDLLAEKDEQIKLLEKPSYHPIFKKEFNYIFQENLQKGTNIHKFGKALDMKIRKGPYKTHNSQGVYEVHRIPTHNSAFTERVVKQLIHKYKLGHPDGGTEFYDINVEYLHNVSLSVCAVIDTIYSTNDTISKRDLAKHLIRNIIKALYSDDSYKSFLPEEILASFQDTFDETHKKLKKALKKHPEASNPIDTIQQQINLDLDALFSGLEDAQDTIDGLLAKEC